MIDALVPIEQSYPTLGEVRNEYTTFALMRFSPDSIGSYAIVLTSTTYVWQWVYVKDELAALPLARHHFLKESVQAVIVAQQFLRQIYLGQSMGRQSPTCTFGIIMAKSLST